MCSSLPLGSLPADQNPAHDPILVAFFEGSGLNYEENVDRLIAQLDASAAIARETRSQQRARRKAERLLSNEPSAAPEPGPA